MLCGAMRVPGPDQVSAAAAAAATTAAATQAQAEEAASAAAEVHVDGTEKGALLAAANAIN